MQAILDADSAILLWIQAHVRAAFATPAVTAVTHLGDHGLFWIALVLILLAIPRTRRIGLVSALALLTCAVITNLIVKNAVARVRPYEVVEGLQRIVEAQKDTSFPSGHTANGLAVAWVIFRLAPKRYGVPVLVLAILISLSRLYVGVHYPTDVLGGAVIGLACGAFALWVERKVAARREAKAPRKS